VVARALWCLALSSPLPPDETLGNGAIRSGGIEFDEMVVMVKLNKT
jgi:hypothetical protein